MANDVSVHRTVVDVHDFDAQGRLEVFSADMVNVIPGSVARLYIGNANALTQKLSGDCRLCFSVPYPMLLKKKGFYVNGEIVVTEPSGERQIQAFSTKVLGMNEVRVKDIGKQVSMSIDPEDPDMRALILDVAERTKVCAWAPDDALTGIWDAVSRLSLRYSSLTGSTIYGYQHTSDVSEIIESGVFNCVDITLIFQTLFHICGAHPVFITLKNHAMPGLLISVNDKVLSETRFQKYAIEKIHRGQRIRFLPLEATMVNSSTFEEALKEGHDEISGDAGYEITVPSLDKIPIMTRRASKAVI